LFKICKKGKKEKDNYILFTENETEMLMVKKEYNFNCDIAECAKTYKDLHYQMENIETFEQQESEAINDLLKFFHFNKKISII
jgi:hypothetical protein